MNDPPKMVHRSTHARKNSKLRKNSKEYRVLLMQITGSYKYIENPAEVFAYVIETARGGVENCLATEIYSLIQEGKQLYELPEIIEVPLKSFTDTNKVYPLWLWNGIGRIQWLLNSKRQTETRKETSDRADKVIDFLENKGEDCILITHFAKNRCGQIRIWYEHVITCHA